MYISRPEEWPRGMAIPFAGNVDGTRVRVLEWERGGRK